MTFNHFKDYYKKLEPIKPIAIALIAALGIWFGGPQIAIADKVLLASTSSRLVCLLLIAIGWGLYNTLSHKHDKHDNKTAEVDIPQESIWHTEQTLNILKSFNRKLQQAIELLNTNKNKMKTFFIRKTLPCYLIMGPTQAGKTSLLLHTGLELTDVRKSKLITPTPTQQFDWWFSPHAIYIDTAGNLSEPVWGGILNILTRYRRYHPIKGLIITLSLPSLYSPYQQQLQLDALKKQFAILSRYKKSLPVYFVFTHSDLIAGFTDFFDDLGIEEREQCWGMSFENNTPPENLSQDYERQFIEFLKRLNERLIWRMHQEHNANKRVHIKDFPLQMENLKASIGDIINQLFETNHLQLRGIYFTSSLQKGIPTDYLNNATANTAITSAEQYNSPFKQRHKPYFSKQLFGSLILSQTESLRTQNKFTKWLPLAGFFAIILLSMIAVTGVVSKRHHDNTSETFSALNVEAPTQETTPQSGLLFELNQLEQAGGHKSYGKSWLSHLGFGHNKKTQQLAHDEYYQTLINIFLPHFKKTIEAEINTNLTDHPSMLYNSLKSYVMLSNPDILDKSYLEDWYTGLLPTDQHELGRHLHNLLSEKLPEVTLDSTLINTARDSLNHLSLPDLLLVVLNNSLQRAPALEIHLPSELFAEQIFTIPAMYQIKNFHQIYFDLIPNLSKNVLKNNWVLGANNQLSTIAPTELTAGARILYLKQYASFWSDSLSKMNIIHFENVQQASQALTLLSKPTPELQLLLTAITTNTAMNREAPEFNRSVANQFETLNTLIQQINQSGKHNAITTSINALAANLNKISGASDSAKMAFVIATGRMQLRDPQDPFTQVLTLANSLPPPLHTWLNKLAANSWKVILQDSQQYINSIWQSTVLSAYDTTIDQHYPLFKESESDIALNDFAKFFAPNGIIDQFFQTYLQPFIDTKQTYWTWKKVDGEQLAITQASLEMLMRASLIRKMYFADGKPLPSVGFTLVPVALSPTATAFALEIGGQQIQLAAAAENPEKTHFTWPSLEAENVTLKFTNLQGEPSTLTEAGPWALFRLLDKAHLTTTTSPKRFKLTFDLNGSAAKYELIADKPVNPFIEGILSSFRCPRSL